MAVMWLSEVIAYTERNLGSFEVAFLAELEAVGLTEIRQSVGAFEMYVPAFEEIGADAERPAYFHARCHEFFVYMRCFASIGLVADHF